MIKDANFTNLSANEGGAVYVKMFTGFLSIINCVFTKNYASLNGGALYIQGISNTAT